MLGFGLIFGSISDQAQNAQGAALDWYRNMGFGAQDQLADAFSASMIEMAGLAAAIYTVQVLLRMRTEEADGPLEPILATAVSRPRWVMSHVMNACLGAAGLLLIFSVSMALTAGASIGNTPRQLRELPVAGLVQLPAVLVIGGVVIAVVGLFPRWSGPVSWTVLLLAILFGPVFGISLNLPNWVLNISPFTHIPKMPAAEITPVSIAVLLVLGAALAVAGLVSTRRRNLVLPA